MLPERKSREPTVMPMISLRLIRLAMVGLLALGLAGCGRSESYRYKLTLAVNTPDGVKRGSTVTEWIFWEVSIPERGTPHKLRGEALYLDLGPGARPLEEHGYFPFAFSSSSTRRRIIALHA